MAEPAQVEPFPVVAAQTELIAAKSEATHAPVEPVAQFNRVVPEKAAPIAVPAQTDGETLAAAHVEPAAPAPRNAGKGRIVWLIAATFCVLAIAAGAFWTFELRKAQHSAGTTTPIPPPSTSTAGVIPVGPVTPPRNKPEQIPQQSKAGSNVQPPRGGSYAGLHPVGQDQTKLTVKPERIVPPPAPPTSGRLHYAGPPVQYGQTVAFANLPGQKLRFTFDHNAWQPIISRQPDGTQTLILRSLKQETQTQCDVSWQLLQ